MNQTKYSNDRSLSIPTCKSLRIRPTCLSGPTNQAHYLLSDHYMHPFHKSQNLIMICNRPAGADRQAGVPRRMRCGDRGHGRVAAALGNCNVSTACICRGERHNGSRREREVDRYTLLHCNACKMEWRWYIQGVQLSTSFTSKRTTIS